MPNKLPRNHAGGHRAERIAVENLGFRAIALEPDVPLRHRYGGHAWLLWLHPISLQRGDPLDTFSLGMIRTPASAGAVRICHKARSLQGVGVSSYMKVTIIPLLRFSDGFQRQLSAQSGAVV